MSSLTASPELIELMRKQTTYKPAELDQLAADLHARAVNSGQKKPRSYHYDVAKSRIRQRQLASIGILPPYLAQLLSIAQQAVAAVICFEIQKHGACNAAVTNIAVRAGVCRRTVQRTFAAMRELQLIDQAHRAYRTARNSITIKMAAWRDWLTRRPGPLKRRDATLPPPNSHHFERSALVARTLFEDAVSARSGP